MIIAALYDWATIVQNLLRGQPDGKKYHISRAYIEFDNSGSVVSPIPTFTRDESLSYYSQLSSSSTRDYLRVPVIATAADSSDQELFPGNNIATFYVQTQGTVGVHGKIFSDSVNSRVFGGALVATPDGEDSAQDLVFLRFYLEGDEQILKVVGQQIAINVPLTFN